MAFGLRSEKALQEIFDGDITKLSYVREVSTWYNSIAIQRNHARAVRACATHEDRS